MFEPPGECPVCGEWVPAKRRSCPSCGADAASGWDEETTRYDGINLPGEDGDEEAGHRRAWKASPVRGVPWWVWLTAVVVAGAVAWSAMGGLFRGG